MKKNITLTFSRHGDDFDIQDIQEAQCLLNKIDNFCILRDLKFSSNYEDDGNWFIQFTATIQAKKTLHLMNQLLNLYYHWSYELQHWSNNYKLSFKYCNLNIEVKE